MKQSRQRHRLFTWLIMFAIAMNLTGLSNVSAAEKAKNVIVLIADGCLSEQYTFARWFKGAPLSFDSI